MVVRILLALSVLLAPPLTAQTTIETTSFWDGSSSVIFFGKPNTATYGQTFTVPASDNVLQRFSFFLQNANGGSDLLFRGFVAEWSLSTIALSGPMLFESAVQTGPSGSAFTRYDFDTGGISLTTGGTYVVFLSASGLFGSIPGDNSAAAFGSIPTNGGDPYLGGSFMFNNNGDDLALLTSTPWSVHPSDLAFEIVLGEADASVIPEPSTVLLTGTGMGILLFGAARRRWRRRSEA